MIRIQPIEESELNQRYSGVIYSVDEIVKRPVVGVKDKNKKSLAAAHVRKYIELKLPCPNMVVYGLAGRLFDMGKDELDELLDLVTCVDATDGGIYPVESVRVSDRLYSGQAVLRLIDELEPTKIIHDSLCQVLAKLFTCEGYVVPYDVEMNAPRLVYGNWGVISDLEIDDATLTNYIDNKIKETKSRKLLDRCNLFINMLNALGDDESVRNYLKSVMVVNRISVLPYSMRPQNDNIKHPLTNAYVRLFNYNNDYTIYRGAPEEEFIEYYRMLNKLVNAITYYNPWAEPRKTGSYDDKLQKLVPILDSMKGKKGWIRGRMLRKRQDYSGRAAVVVNPFLPLNYLGVPKVILAKMYQEYVIREGNKSALGLYKMLKTEAFVEYAIKVLQTSGVFDDIPIIMGRNPTLHKHSIQAFKVIPVDGNAIQVSPLVCPAYNMDFDGDTAWTDTPVTPKASREVKKLIMTDHNILLPKTGESTICPRMDIIYGLYMCTSCNVSTGAGGTYAEPTALRTAIYNQEVGLGDTVTVTDYGTGRAGVLAFETCFPKSVIRTMGPTGVITSKTIKKYIEQMQDMPASVFDNMINQVVELGFRVAYLYCHSVSLIKELASDTDKARAFDAAFETFHEQMAPIMELNDYGFYDSETYGMEFSDCLKRVSRALSDGVADKVGEGSMFTHMARSGARGNTDNLVQIFGSKGRIQKSDSELFNVTIEHSLREQLTPTEGFIAANGARKGQIAKSIKTADTGYLGRKLAHAASSIIIREADCGTTDGIYISRDAIRSYLLKENMSEDEKRKLDDTISEIMERFIRGRYHAENGLYIGQAEAHTLAYDVSNKAVKIRSPLTCKNPCCQKCYGDDPSTWRRAAIGLPVGFIAAQSLGEVSTQTTMKEFQKGGVAGAGSVFDRLSALLDRSEIIAKANKGGYPTYDPVAWAPGMLVRERAAGNVAVLRIVPDSRMPQEEQDKYNYNITQNISADARVKEGKYVERGDTLLVERGDWYADDALAIWGLDKTVTELVLSLWFLFKSNANLVPVHIEVVVSNMVGYRPITTDVKELRVGKYYTRHQLCRLGKNYSNTRFMTVIRGVTSVAKQSPNFLESMIMEDQRAALTEAVMNCEFDMVDAPLVQMALARHVQVGTGFSDTFMEDR